MISGVIIAWNEEKNLPRAVHSLQAVADEVVVVVDEASTDGTAKAAKQLGCRVYKHKHAGIVEPMREFAIAKAKNDWIFLLDADEEIPAALAEEIKRLMTHSQTDYYRIPRKNIIFNKWITSAHWWPDYVTRLFRKGSVKWRREIHSQPETQGRGHDLAAEERHALVHYNYSTISQYLEQLNRYTDFQVETLLRSGYKFNWTDLFARPMGEFLSQYFSREGYRLGLHGVVLALLQAYAELIICLKVWERLNFPEIELGKDQVHAQWQAAIRQYMWWYQDGWWARLKAKLGL